MTGTTEPVVSDRRRWMSLAVIVAAALIVVLDTSVLNVAIPTLLRDLDTEIGTLQWVITGYSLTFATFLIVGGRLGDMFGHRRIFIIGCALFAVGSAIASTAQNVGVLIVGEAVIEGIGASLMLPATTAILSRTFTGKERATAFAAWGTTAGAAAAFGPLLGGYLTTEHSWRWSFRINVIVALVTMIGGMLFMIDAKSDRTRRPKIDASGSTLVALGAFTLVLAITSLGEQQWWLSIGAGIVAAIAIALFVVVERAKERTGGDPIFAFGEFRSPMFRNGVIATSSQLAGQGALIFVVPLLLQEVKGLSAFETGLWLVPVGLCIVVGAQVGGRLTRRIGITMVVRTGLVTATVGVTALAFVVGGSFSFPTLLPCFIVYGIGFGLATSQITSVVLSGVAPERAGVASGTNSTGRQVGAALGVAVAATVIAGGQSTTSGRTALFIAAGLVATAALLSWRIPVVGAIAPTMALDLGSDEAIETV